MNEAYTAGLHHKGPQRGIEPEGIVVVFLCFLFARLFPSAGTGQPTARDGAYGVRSGSKEGRIGSASSTTSLSVGCPSLYPACCRRWSSRLGSANRRPRPRPRPPRRPLPPARDSEVTCAARAKLASASAARDAWGSGRAGSRLPECVWASSAGCATSGGAEPAGAGCRCCMAGRTARFAWGASCISGRAASEAGAKPAGGAGNAAALGEEAAGASGGCATCGGGRTQSMAPCGIARHPSMTWRTCKARLSTRPLVCVQVDCSIDCPVQEGLQDLLASQKVLPPEN